MEAYEVPGWPRAVLGHSAVTPNLTRMAASGAVQYKDGVHGHPGTKQIPTGPNFTPSPDRGDIAQMGLSRWQDAPAYFLPNLYWARPQREFLPGAGMPVSVLSDNLMPVPATDPRGIPARLAMPQVRRGPKQPRNVRPVITWPAWNG